MSDTAPIVDTQVQESSARRRSLRRWLFAAVVIVLLTAIAIPLKVFYDCQRVLSAAQAAGGELKVRENWYQHRYLGYWPSATKEWIKAYLPPGLACLDQRQTQVLSFDETAAIDDNWLLQQNLSALPCWVHIRITNPQVTDVGIQSIGNIPFLHGLLLQRTSLTDEGLMAFTGRPHLFSLSLHETGVTDASLPVLTSLPRLSNLYVSQTDIAGDELLQLRMCPNLYLLAVDAGQLTEPFLSSLSTFPALTELLVFAPPSSTLVGSPESSVDNQAHALVDDDLLRRLLGETTLTTLYIDDGSAITDASVPALVKAGHIQHLDIWNVDMTDDGALKVNSIHHSRFGGDKPAILLSSQSTKYNRDDYWSWYK